MVREATLDDIPAIVELGRQFLNSPEYGGRLMFDAERLTGLAAQIIEAASSVVFVDDQDGNVTGMIAMTLMEHPFSGQRVAGEVCWWVTPTCRGGGMRLYHAAERWARDHEAELFQMGAPTEKVAHFYRRLGFEPVEAMYQRRL